MNDKLKNLSVNPSPEVWDSIAHTLHRRRLLHRVFTGAAVAVVTGVVAALLLNKPAAQQSPVTASNSAVAELPEAVPVASDVSEEISEQQNPSVPEVAVAASRVEPKAIRPVSNLPKIESAAAMNAAQKEILPEVYEAPETPESTAVSEAVAAMLEEEQTTVDNMLSGSTKTSAAKNTTDEAPILWIPNAFAPEGDVDANRTFKAVPSQAVTDFQMYIFSRAGQEVFHTTDISTAWDGRKNGVLLPQSAYVYLVKYKDNKGIIHTQKGTVTLIR